MLKLLKVYQNTRKFNTIPKPVDYKKFINKQLFINNQFVNSISSNQIYFDTVNPANEQVLSHICQASLEDVNYAVECARNAGVHNSIWKKMGANGRADLMYKLANLMERDRTILATLESVDCGKPYSTTFNREIPGATNYLRYFAGWADKISGKTISPLNDGTFSMTIKEPYGVCALILPWNFPLTLFCIKMAAALAAGNTVVIKPAEQTPLSALHMATLIQEAGFPEGVINIVNGFEETGENLVTHKDVKFISFTGSCEVGKKIQKKSVDSLVRPLLLELGGKSPNIIFDDVDLSKSVEIAHRGIFSHQGQICCSNSRIYVHENIYDQFLKMSIEMAERIVVGDTLELNTTYGPMISQVHHDKVMNYIKNRSKNSRICTGGKRTRDFGYFIEPTVIDQIEDDDKMTKEEIFGPIMQIYKFNDEKEVIDRANDTNFGLAAGVMTKDISRALRVAKQLNAGTVWINCYHALKYNVPFGGYNDSGVGREKGEDGIYSYMQTKSITIQENF